MIDKKFYNIKEKLTIKNICNVLSISIPSNCDPDFECMSIERLNEATDRDISFFHNPKYATDLFETNAFACLIQEKFCKNMGALTIPIIVDDPYFALAKILNYFIEVYAESKKNETSISKTAQIGRDCVISGNVSIGDGCIIGDNCFIGSNSVILDGTIIGDGSIIESNVTIGFSIIGNNARIKSGARIGQQGFGFHVGNQGITDVLQIGRVIIGDDVQIGANTTIDRGSIGDTTIGKYCRIDNLVHIAHNVELGEYCVIAAQTGVAGSTKVGNGCVFGGQVGIAGHLNIGNRVTIAAQSGVMNNVSDGQKIAGSPATNIINWHRQTVIIKNLVADRRK